MDYICFAMNDDWRLRVDLHEHRFAHQLSELLSAAELEHELERAFKDKIVVSVDDNEVFCYAGTQAQAQAAEQLIRQLAAQHEWEIDVELTHWHPVSETWESPDEPLPGHRCRDRARTGRARRHRAGRVRSAGLSRIRGTSRVRVARRGRRAV